MVYTVCSDAMLNEIGTLARSRRRYITNLKSSSTVLHLLYTTKERDNWTTRAAVARYDLLTSIYAMQNAAWKLDNPLSTDLKGLMDFLTSMCSRQEKSKLEFGKEFIEFRIQLTCRNCGPSQTRENDMGDYTGPIYFSFYHPDTKNNVKYTNALSSMVAYQGGWRYKIYWEKDNGQGEIDKHSGFYHFNNSNFSKKTGQPYFEHASRSNSGYFMLDTGTQESSL